MDDNVYSQMNKESNGVDIDEIPIPVSKPKTFEELLEEEMARGTQGGIVAETASPARHKQDGTAVQKREFLKRKTNMNMPPPRNRGSSKYRYYVDNFKQQSEGSSSQPEVAKRRNSIQRKEPPAKEESKLGGHMAKARGSQGNLRSGQANKQETNNENTWTNEEQPTEHREPEE